jgi:peptidoglycan biosynthesis protein MviN/MurJ (putative lipid II flippase)
MRFLAHVGIAIALSAAGWMQALALLALLARHGYFRLDRRARGNIPRIAAAALVMAGVLIALKLLLAPALGGSALMRLGALAGLIAAGLFSFAALILVLGVTDWREVRGRPRTAGP